MKGSTVIINNPDNDFHNQTGVIIGVSSSKNSASYIVEFDGMEIESFNECYLEVI